MYYIVTKATVDKSRRVLSVWEGQCHQMDENKLGANSCRKTSIFSIDIVNRIHVAMATFPRIDFKALARLRAEKVGF